ncbi:MAG: hypothetical protein ABII72_04180 [Parcubacteria group bacterium]
MRKIQKLSVLAVISAMLISAGVVHAQPTMMGARPGSYEKPVMITAKCTAGELYWTANNKDPRIGMKMIHGKQGKAESGQRVFVVCKDLTLKVACVDKAVVSTIKTAAYVIESRRPTLKYTFKGDRKLARTYGAHLRIGCYGKRKGKKGKGKGKIETTTVKRGDRTAIVHIHKGPRAPAAAPSRRPAPAAAPMTYQESPLIVVNRSRRPAARRPAPRKSRRRVVAVGPSPEVWMAPSGRTTTIWVDDD